MLFDNKRIHMVPWAVISSGGGNIFAENGGGKKFLERMKYFLSYVVDVFNSGEWKLYEEDGRDRKREKRGRYIFRAGAVGDGNL